MYQFDQRPNTVFSEQAQQLLEEIRQSSYSVLCGRNNCGKSFILKTLTQTIGQRASYLGPARYQNFNVLSYFTPNRNRRNEVWNNFIIQWQNQQQNLDNSPVNLQQASAELNDHKRDQLLEIMEKLLGSKMELKYTVPENSMSQKYISVDGHNISFTSSGYRLISTLVTSLLDEEADTFLIDEPELGVSPEAQGVFSDFIFDENVRSKYFSHIKTLILATHSTIFLDRKNILNNYFIEKNNNHIDISRVSSVADINKIHFFLLGNRLEALYMPSG
jgi:predicted ATP-dependent endonuclease of OLD family